MVACSHALMQVPSPPQPIAQVRMYQQGDPPLHPKSSEQQFAIAHDWHPGSALMCTSPHADVPVPVEPLPGPAVADAPVLAVVTAPPMPEAVVPDTVVPD